MRGSTRMYDAWCSRVASEPDTLVVSVDYHGANVLAERRAPTTAVSVRP
ncbi:hypothetical protein [Streptomyces sp. NPDC051561]